jgi:hypothetical protein
LPLLLLLLLLLLLYYYYRVRKKNLMVSKLFLIYKPSSFFSRPCIITGFVWEWCTIIGLNRSPHCCSCQHRLSFRQSYS